jgi:hypothetical protein
MEWHVSRAVRHAFDFQAWIAKVEQQAERQASCLEIFDTLSVMRVVQ